MLSRMWIWLLVIVCAACNLTGGADQTRNAAVFTVGPPAGSPEAVTEEATEESVVETPPATPSIAPSSSPTQTPLPSDTPTVTMTATHTIVPTDTLLPSETPVPLSTPLPVPRMSPDNLQLIDLPEQLVTGLNQPYVVFVNENDSLTISNLSTAEPDTGREIVYFAHPRNPSDRIPVLEFTSSSRTPIFPAPSGAGLAYFLADNGLYVLDILSGLSLRIMAIDSLVQRGLSTSPAWRADGRLLVMTTESGYSLDIMAFDLNTSAWQPLVTDGSHDFWPSFSRDARYLAFVSDRETCPTWDPREANACEEGVDPAPTGGHVYVLELESGEVTRLSDEPTFEPPYWINNSELAFTTGDPLELLDPARSLWLASVNNGSAREILPEGVSSAPFNLSEAWSPDGSEVIFQKADGSTTETVVMNADGEIVASLDDLSFSRFTLAATWSPDGTRVAVGGGGGQCPYGVRVLDDNFQRVASGGIPPTMCAPIFSGNGQYIAFTGVNTARGDGRVDVYTVSPNGVDRVTLTLDLRGQMRLIGWVGPG